MTAKKVILCGCVALFTCSTVSAATFNVRQEFRSETGESTRVKLGSNIGNFSFSGELKFKPVDGSDKKASQNNGWELGLDYRFKINDNWTILPGMPIEAREKGMTYKPQIRVNYAFDSVEGLTLTARYRHDFYRNNSEVDKQRHRLTTGVGYSTGDWKFGFEADLYKAVDYDIYDNGDSNYELNLTVARKMGKWTPYVEFGDINVSADSDQRELRTRIGLTYSY